MKSLALSLALALSLVFGSTARARDLLAPIDNTHDFLKVDEAFEIQPLLVKDGQFAVSWRIAPGYFLYRPRLSVTVVSPKNLKLRAPALPPGLEHNDELFGKVEIYSAPGLQMRVPLKGALPDQAILKVSYQGCAEAGLCYPSQERTLEWKKR